MAGSQITIDPESVQAIVSKAIVESLSEEARTNIIEEAVKHLVTAPASTGYSSAKLPTPLQQAFNVAVEGAARTVIKDMVEAGELTERIRTLVREQVVVALASGNGVLVESIGNAVGEAVKNALRKAEPF